MIKIISFFENLFKSNRTKTTKQVFVLEERHNDMNLYKCSCCHSFFDIEEMSGKYCSNCRNESIYEIQGVELFNINGFKLRLPYNDYFDMYKLNFNENYLLSI
jgi:hypothetical protein